MLEVPNPGLPMIMSIARYLVAAIQEILNKILERTTLSMHALQLVVMYNV